MPSTAASDPRPMATVNTSTHRIVGIERMMATKPFTALETAGLDRFAEAASARKNDTMADSTVQMAVTATVMTALSSTVAQVKWDAPSGGSSAGWSIMAPKSARA